MKFQKLLRITDTQQLVSNPPQRGQWIQFAWCSAPSRFHSANPRNVTAFHFPRAVSGFNSYCNATKSAR